MSTPAADAEVQNEGTEQAQGPDFSPVMDRLEQIDARLGGFEERFQSQGEPEAEADESYQDFVNRLFAGDEEAQAQAERQPEVPAVFRDPNTFQELVDRAVQEQLNQHVTPELEALRNDRFQREVSGLLEAYPALENVDTQREIVLAAQQLAEELGQPEMWRSPRIIEMVYLAEQARQTSDAEVPAGANGGEARLEAGGGNPGAEEPGLADQLIQAHGGSKSIFR